MQSLSAPLRSSREPSLPSQRNENPSTMDDLPLPFSPKIIVTFFSGSKSTVAFPVAPRKVIKTSCLSFVFGMVCLFSGFQLEQHLPIIGCHLSCRQFVGQPLYAALFE